MTGMKKGKSLLQKAKCILVCLYIKVVLIQNSVTKFRAEFISFLQDSIKKRKTQVQIRDILFTLV